MKHQTQPPWITKSVLKHLHLRDHLLKVARRTDSVDDWTKYRVARNKAVSILRASKSEYFSKSFEENKNNTSAIWTCIKTLTGASNNNGVIKKFEVNGLVMENAKDIAEQFNIYFSTIAEKLRGTLRQTHLCL